MSEKIDKGKEYFKNQMEFTKSTRGKIIVAGDAAMKDCLDNFRIHGDVNACRYGAIQARDLELQKHPGKKR